VNDASPEPSNAEEKIDLSVSRWNRVTRFIASGPNNLLKRWIISVALSRVTVENHDRQGKLVYQWFRGHSPTTVVPRDYLKRVVLINAFFDGMDWVTKTIWPITCISLLAYDYSNYHSPQLRYQNHWQDIMLGTSPNNEVEHGALLSHLGSDIPAESDYWSGYIALFGSMGTMAIINFLWRAARFHVEDDNNDNNQNNLGLNQNNNHRWGRSVMTHHMLRYLWDHDISQSAIENTIEELADMSKNGSIIRRGRALHALASIVDSFGSSSSSNKIDKARGAKEKLLDVAKSDTLNRHPLSVFSYVYAHYQLWRIGHHRSKRAHAIFYTTVVVPQVFFLYHLWRLFLQKIIGFSEFKRAAKACQQDGQFWRLIDQIGNYDCLTCDTPLVDYPNAQSGQGCLTQSLHVPQHPETVESMLDDYADHGPFTSLDLSRQHWWSWSSTQWQQIANQLSNYPDQLFQVMNLSTAVRNNHVIPMTVLKKINAILEKREVGVLDLNNQWLGDAGVGILLNGLDPEDIQHLNLSGCGLTDVGIVIVSDWLTNNDTMSDPQLQTLQLANNNFTAYGIEVLFQSLINTRVSQLDLKNNLISHDGVSIISTYLDLTELTQLDLSHTDFSQANITEFGQALQVSSLQVLRMQHCNLGDINAMRLASYLNESVMLTLDWSNNEIGYQGIAILSDILPNSLLTHLYLSKNQIDDAALGLLTQTLNASSVELLAISNNPITYEGFSQLLQYLSNNTHVLSSLYVDNTNIGGFSTRASNNWLVHSQVQQLSLRNTGLTVDDLTQLSTSLSNSTLTHLWLSQNRLVDNFLELTTHLVQSPVRVLDISQTQITSELFQPFITGLPNSQLESVNLENNYLSNDNGILLAQTLVTALPQQNALGGMSYNNRDFFRALHKTLPNTQLRELQLAHNALDDEAVHALCLALPQTIISIKNFDVSDNFWTFDAIDVLGCPINQSTSVKNGRLLLEDTNQNDSVNNNQASITLLTSPLFILFMLMATTSVLTLVARTSVGKVASSVFNCRRHRFFNRTSTSPRTSIARSDEDESRHDYEITL
jgi:Ran GTPase-activating protein (RanGAP) involved in mRNA processing and transport